MEIWKPIKNYETNYEISNYGNIRAKYREFIGNDGKIKRYPERILKPEVFHQGGTSYKRVSLSKNHKVTRFLVHRLVANAFIPNNSNKPFINHLDNNGLNNHVSNLEWCTHSENMLHAQSQGRLFQSQSKGGKKGGQTKNKQAMAKANALVNTYKDAWIVKGVSSIRRNKKICLDLECTLCKQIYTYTMEYFKNSIGYCCIKCKSR